MASVFQLHVERWQECTACPLHETRQKVVLARGSVPCDVLFVGEAPGESEDCLGAPFVGPAGQLLDQIVARALRAAASQAVLRLAFTNLVCCIPRDANGDKATKPEHDDVLSCQPRLEEFVYDVAKPKLVVTVGKEAQDYLDQGYRHSLKLPAGTKQAHITHPAAILRMNEAQKGLEAQRCRITLANALGEL